LSLALPYPSSPLSPFPIFLLVRSYECLPHLYLFLPWCPNSLFLLFPSCTETFSPILLLLQTATRSLHPRLNRPDRSQRFLRKHRLPDNDPPPLNTRVNPRGFGFYNRPRPLPSSQSCRYPRCPPQLLEATI
jgi:hypothetical protein